MVGKIYFLNTKILIMKQYLINQLEAQRNYIYDLAKDAINEGDYELNDFLNVSKCDKMSAHVSDSENYNFELGKYVTFQDIYKRMNY